MRKSIALLNDAGEVLHCEDAILPIYSISKTYIAACIFVIDIDIDRKVSDWIDAKVLPTGHEINVRQLLNHTSGLRDYGALEQYQRAIRAGPIWSDEDFVDATLRQNLLHSPGTKWSYSNPGYWLLSQIVQLETGLLFEEYITQLITRPLGLTHTSVAQGIFAEDLPEYSAQWVWHGLLLATASEVAKFVASDLVARMYEASNYIGVPVQHPDWVDPHWGLGLMIDPGIRYGHNGDGPKYSAACFRSLETGTTSCVLSSATEEGIATSQAIKLLGSVTRI